MASVVARRALWRSLGVSRFLADADQFAILGQTTQLDALLSA
jgi:hypothetical protein